MGNIDIQDPAEKGIPVTSVSAVNSCAVADLTFGLMIVALRHIQKSKNFMKSGRWRDERFMGG